MANLTSSQLLSRHEAEAPKDLIASMESLADALSEYVDIRRQPSVMFESKMVPIVTNLIMEEVEPGIRTNLQYEDNDIVYLESMTEDILEAGTPVSMTDAHVANLTQLMENSAGTYRTALANQRSLNELTPFDAFLPFTIVRSYLPLISKDIVPYVVPKIPFIRIKEQFQYIITKDNSQYLIPDVYNDPDTAQKIIDSGKGPKVIQDWLPAGTTSAGTVAAGTADYEIAGVAYDLPADKLQMQSYDLLGQSGGVRTIGDSLDINVCVVGARAKVTNSQGKTYMVEAMLANPAYPDLTSITPQRSVSFDVKYNVKNNAGEIEGVITDTIFGNYNANTSMFNLVSMTGVTKQIKFGGNLSNKNNMEYVSFRDEWDVKQHPIAEGFSQNVPITVQDLQLYNETASIDIIANSINKMTQIATNLEDISVIKKIKDEFNTWVGVGANHPFKHFQNGPVVFSQDVDVTYSNQLMPRNQYVQDTIAWKLARMIGEVRQTCQNEPFRIVLFAHPNICSLFVGQNIDWKITPGTSVAEGIRSDYAMGIYTANGDSLRLVSSQKIAEEEGIRGLIFPVNEENFLSWKHFKYSIYFDQNHRIQEMPNNPNILGIARFQTQSYVPLQLRLTISNYK